ncbi:MAG: alginate export family protein [Polyangiales bacterium]
MAFDTTGEVYLFVLGQDPDQSENRTRARRVYTPGIRLLRSPKRGDSDLDVEVVLQGGDLYPNSADSDLHVFAQFVHATFGYTFDVPWSPRVSAELDYASGERNADDGRWGRFNTLFGPRRADFGPTGEFGLLGRENIISQGLRFVVKPIARFDAFVSDRANFLDSRTDVFARSGVEDPTGQSGRFAGHQIELRTRLWLLQNVILWELGGAVFLNGEFMRTAPDVNGYGDPLYVYSDLGFVF